MVEEQPQVPMQSDLPAHAVVVTAKPMFEDGRAATARSQDA